MNGIFIGLKSMSVYMFSSDKMTQGACSCTGMCNDISFMYIS